jgi:hypothetical protein
VVRRHWVLIFSLVPTVHIDIGHRAPAVIGIARAAWPAKAGNGSKADSESLTDSLLPLRLHSTGRT